MNGISEWVSSERRDSKLFHAILCGPVLTRSGVVMTVSELVEWTASAELAPRLWSHAVAAPLAREYSRPVFGDLSFRVASKLRVPSRWMDWRLRRAVVRAVRPGEIVYMFPPYDLDLVRQVRERGAIAVGERINCMGKRCRAVLEPAFARLGRGLPDGWCTPEAIEEEREIMAACDYVTAPNAFVASSLVESGIPKERILETSYGWSPARLASSVGVTRPDRDPVFLFVGLGNVRKGLNLLLEAWARAEVRGTLLLAGTIDEDLAFACREVLSLPSVRALGYVTDIASVYALADVFVFPSHEEGGPQVTYEAAACGLPSIVSPMGAGRLVHDGREGLVVDPFDTEGWARAIRSLAEDPTLRRRMAQDAVDAVQDFTWERVGARLREHFLRIMRGGRPA